MIFDDIIFNYKNDLMETSKNDVYDSSTGFLLGNMFKDEYIGYRNYKVSRLIPTNEKAALLLEIYELDFAMNDLSLYLDIHPEDDALYNLFRQYSNRLGECMLEYERKYGPLELNNTNYDSYLWYKGKWPFEGVEL